MEQSTACRILSEDPFLLSEGPQRVRKSRSSLWMLIMKGRERQDGKTIYLESCRLEGGLATSCDALQRFRAKLNDFSEKDTK